MALGCASGTHFAPPGREPPMLLYGGVRDVQKAHDVIARDRTIPMLKQIEFVLIFKIWTIPIRIIRIHFSGSAYSP